MQRRTDPVIGEFETVRRQRHRMFEAGVDADVWRAAVGVNGGRTGFAKHPFGAARRDRASGSFQS
jgi:hypothetical protein